MNLGNKWFWVIMALALIVVITILWLFSPPLTVKQALKDVPFSYTEIVANYNVEGNEVFFLKNDSQFSSNVIEKKGLFYNYEGPGSHHFLEKPYKLRASFFIGYDENTEIITTMVVAWEDVTYVKFNGEYLDKTEYEGYTLFYGYSLEYTYEHPTLYDENYNEIDYHTDENK